MTDATARSWHVSGVVTVGVFELPAILLVDPLIVRLLPLPVVARAAEDSDATCVMTCPVVPESRWVDVIQLGVTSGIEWMATTEATSMFFEERFEERQQPPPAWAAWIIEYEVPGCPRVMSKLVSSEFQHVQGKVLGLLLMPFRLLVKAAATVEVPHATVWRFPPSTPEVLDQRGLTAELAQRMSLSRLLVRQVRPPTPGRGLTDQVGCAPAAPTDATPCRAACAAAAACCVSARRKHGSSAKVW